MFQVGLNPYGIACSVGLQGVGSPRRAPNPLGLNGFIDYAVRICAKFVELDLRHLQACSPTELNAARDRIKDAGLGVILSAGPPSESMPDAIEMAKTIGARLVRMSMTRVLCGDRSAQGDNWHSILGASEEALIKYAPIARDQGIDFGIEDHQDLGSEELLAYAEAAGPNVGIVFDTGNPLAVGEDILAFGRRVAHRICHVHLKDYRAQFTDQGYRLVRCAIGDGCVPFVKIGELFFPFHASLTASLEPGALEARHIRLFTADWWRGYPPRSASELGQALATARHNRLEDLDDWRTPWERECDGQEICDFEMAMMERSVQNVRDLGWI